MGNFLGTFTDNHSTVEANILQSVFPERIWLLIAEKMQSVNGKISPDLLNCRLVCRSWQIGIDSALQHSSNYNKLLDTDGHNGLGTSLPPKSSETYFRLPENTLTFLRHFDENYASENRNPFIGRSVYVYYSKQITDRVSFNNQLLQILTMYGHHVWHFRFMFVFAYPLYTVTTNVEFFQLLRDCLQLMPNLKMLRFNYDGPQQTQNHKALELTMQSWVFPELKNLRHLHMSNVPTPVFDTLLRRYSHVTMLSTWYHSPGFTDLLMYTHPMPNLTQVAFCFSIINTLAHKLTQLADTDALWPLKTLIISIDSYHLDWSLLFQFLESRWAATLTELKIDNQTYYPVQDLSSLTLPNLEVFILETGAFVALDFILPMKNSLKRLVVRYIHNDLPRWGQLAVELERLDLESEFENEGEIQLYKFRRNLRDSNIWRLFPKLDIVEYCDWEVGEQSCCRPIQIA